MTTPTAGARASRRAAARQAAAATPPATTAAPTKPEKIETPEALADLMSTDAADVTEDEIDEAFGPEDLDPRSQASQRPANSRPASRPTNAPIVVPEATNARGGAIALPMEDLTRQIGVEDQIIPKLRLSQAMSKANTLYATSRGKEGVSMGNWYNSADGKSLGDTVYFVPVDMRKSRAYFVPGTGLMCRSFDLVQGVGNPGIMCEGTPEERLTVPSEHRGCELRLWNDRTPPPCGLTYNFPGFVIPEIDDPKNTKPINVILQMRSTSTRAAREMITRVMNDGERIWSNCIFELGVESQSNAKGTFFVPTVDLYYTMEEALEEDPEFKRIQKLARRMARAMGAVDTSAFEDGSSD